MEKKILVTQSSMPPYEEYIEAIKPLWDTHWLTNMGTYHRQLEEELKAYLGIPGLSLMVNGHMSLELAIQMFDFPRGRRADYRKDRGDTSGACVWKCVQH
jgi:dTDP-4-amino-4,6-dideoxygalactose transaminase